MTRIFIDGDACPVKQETIKAAKNFSLPVLIFTTIHHFSMNQETDYAETIYVEDGKESVDYALIGKLKPKDILITQDYGLASLALEKKVYVFHQNGWRYTENNISQLLESRYLSAQMRKAGQRTKGPKKFTNIQREAFYQTLSEFLTTIQ